MSFLNATLMLGVAAAAIPLLLHLIARREPKRFVFPAVRFLTERIEANRSRLKVRRWLLLALRAALLALLAIALARPQIHQAASGTWMTIGIVALGGIGLLALAAYALARQLGRALMLGLLAAGIVLLLFSVGWAGVVWAGSAPLEVTDDAPAAVAIVVDNSPRSAYVGDQGSRLEQMQETADWLISRYPRDSRIAILDRSARPASFALDNAAAMRAIAKLEARQTVQPLAERIEAAVRLVRSSELNRRAVFVLSDLTEESWTPADAPGAALSLPPLLAEPPDVALQVVRLDASPSDAAEPVVNRRLGIPKIADATPAREVTVPLSVRVSLEPGTEPTAVQCELQLYELSSGLPVVRDGQTVLPPINVVDRTSGNATADAPAELFFALPPLLPGTHHGRIQLSGNDPLALDDMRYFTITIRPPGRLLIISDDPPAADHLARILNAEFDPGDPRAEFAIQRVSTERFHADLLAEVDAVAMLDPARSKIAKPSLEALLQWIQSGGNLFVALGSAGSEGPLPSTAVQADAEDAMARLFPLRRVWRIPEGTFLEVTRPAHPIFSELSEIPGGIPWSAFRVQRYWQVEQGATDAVLARFAGTQHAALLERPIGEGHVVILTTPIVPSSQHRLASWNELYSAADAWPSFLLTRQIFDFVGKRDVGNFNVLVGSPVMVPLADAASDVDRLQMFMADVPPVPVPTDGQSATVGTAPKAGNYWLRGTNTPVGFSANLPESATQLTTIDPALLQDILGEGNFDFVTDRDAIVAAEGRSSDARPLYAQAMLLVLALFLFEQLLANRFYRSSRSAAPLARRLPATGTR